MFEIIREPDTEKLMRHAAWERQQRAIHAFLKVQRRTKKQLTASHFTAAALMGVATTKEDSGIYVSVKQHESRYRMKGVRFKTWNNADTTGDAIEIAGILCSSPEATFAQLSREISFEDAIILGDSLVCRDSMLRRTNKKSIENYLRDCLPFQNRNKCLRALSRVRENTDSPAETKMRIMLCRYGFPEPEINYRINLRSSYYLLDMAYPEYQIGIEFNGQHHHHQIAEDWERFNTLQSLGWQIFTAEKDNLGSPALDLRFCDDLERAYRRAGDTGFSHLERPMSMLQLCDRKHQNKKNLHTQTGAFKNRTAEYQRS
ncbi:hypothetical protein [Bifidobacterium sp. ESL0790]|uniref:hypothetical protein n=1 Tax=Bifidobacterium sp. ESL0790 TaxID=2983233 RepID=UPI0023F64DAE|nr:hypothetical protein [Bifidobacterium sp. ESL0790]WEV72308.1 hypothetical protein OZY47_07750 [Bifidobacterium sp. ESL0790]